MGWISGFPEITEIWWTDAFEMNCRNMWVKRLSIILQGYEGMSGVVGDRVIVVKSHRGGFGKPTLEIWNYKSEKSIENIDIISYIDWLNSKQ